MVEVAKKKAQQRAEGALERWIEKLTKANVNVKVVGRYGDPAEQIQDVIGESKIDLVAMASHGRTGLARWRFGSVAEKVLRDCRCPVLVETSPRRG